MKSTQSRYVIFILAIILTIVANEIILQKNLEAQESDAELINLSGRQRMLSQRIAKQLLFLQYEEEKNQKNYNTEVLRITTEEWETAHSRLKLLSLNLPNRKMLDSLFLVTDVQVKSIAEASHKVSENYNSKVLEESLQTIIPLELPFLMNMENIVSAYQQQAENKLSNTKRTVLLLSCFSIVLLIIEFLFIISPFLRKLVRKNNELVHVNKQLADFAHITSHNLRSPVKNLNSLLNIYLSSTDPNDREEIFSKFTMVVHHLTNTLDTLVETILIKNNKDVKIETLDLQETFEKTKEVLSGTILDTAAAITFDFTKAPKLKFNRLYLESIFLNIIGNAMKYKDEGRSPEITVKSEERNGKTILSFEDNGLGIDMERYGKKLFGLHKTFHRHPEAKGLGLYMTKIQIESQGGSIFAESEVGHGSVFTVVI